ASDVGVVVVTYNSARTIARCLELLLGSAVVARLVVVDNASTGRTMGVLELFAKVHPEITLVKNPDNRGFSSACNQGASALSTPWVAFINPDCFVTRDTLARLVRHGLSRAGPAFPGGAMPNEFAQADPAARRRDPSLRELMTQRGSR